MNNNEYYIFLENQKGDFCGVITNNFSLVYPWLNHFILHSGNKLESRDGMVYEILDFRTQIINPYRRCVGGCKRNINIFFLLAEAIWIALGRRDVEFLTIFNKNMANFSDNGIVFHAPYGWRLRNWGVPAETEDSVRGFDQVINSIRLLSENSNTRQVVMSIWNPEFDLSVKSKDLPCNDMVMLKIRDNKLIVTIQNRSNDLHWGLPTNIFQFSFLSELMALSLGIELGTQTHNSQSLHIYNWSDVAKIMEDEYINNAECNELYKVSECRKIDFNFRNTLPVNRFREIEYCLHIIVDNISLFNSMGIENSDDLEELRYYSQYLFAVYNLLKIYIIYKKHINVCNDKDEIRISCIDMISSLGVWGENTWDISLLAKNFFGNRVNNNCSVDIKNY